MRVIGRSIVAFCVAVVGAATQAGGQLPTTIAVGSMVRLHRPYGMQRLSVARVMRVRGDSLDLTFSDHVQQGNAFRPTATYPAQTATVLWSDVDVVVGYDTHRLEGFEEGLIGGPIGGAIMGWLAGRSCIAGCLEGHQLHDLVKIGAGIGLIAGPIHGVVVGSQRRTLVWGPATGVQSVAIEPALINQRPSLSVSIPF